MNDKWSTDNDVYVKLNYYNITGLKLSSIYNPHAYETTLVHSAPTMYVIVKGEKYATEYLCFYLQKL